MTGENLAVGVVHLLEPDGIPSACLVVTGVGLIATYAYVVRTVGARQDGAGAHCIEGGKWNEHT